MDMLFDQNSNWPKKLSTYHILFKHVMEDKQQSDLVKL